MKRILLFAAIYGVCALVAFKRACWWALSGQFDYIEDGCGLLAELMPWPILSIVLVGIAATPGWAVRRRRARR
ncbi:hypothetical protein [Xanthomonas bromi]|uniref:hypothetical protein n=1 Tax=Xanthomonas bromi TaxID=56449 RepID=UPI0011129398|nr:hypothetical protein [Xanthomonas bromi]